MTKKSYAKFLLLLIQLALVLSVAHLFKIEENFGFLRITYLLFFGFMVHSLLPFRFRLPFFLVLSIGFLGLLVGAKNCAGLVVVGLGLIGLCHLPVSFGIRVALLSIVASFFAVIRVGLFETFWESFPTRVLPILASMFMFRTVLYLHHLRHERNSPSIWARLSYFFLLPNPVFLFFPVIDYGTYLRTYYNMDPFKIYEKGIHWMLRGIVHLLLYRLVYLYLVPVPSEVTDLEGVVVFMTSSYLLYLRVSGLFHLVVGILCLFGFNLPETHRLYFLASSFTDLWRRINIYWKDFMLNLMYYPIFMKLRKFGLGRAMVFATLITLISSWLLHSYQWFWLLGTFPLTLQDGVFWGLLGVFVAINSLYELKTRRKHTSKGEWNFRSAAGLSLRTVAMFCCMCFLWSFWTSTSISEWTHAVSTASSSGILEWILFGVCLLGLVGFGILFQFLKVRVRLSLGDRARPLSTSVLTTVAALMLLVIGMPEVSSAMGPQAVALVQSTKGTRLNERDEAQLTRGYYEELLGTQTYTSGLWTFRVREPKDWIHIRDTVAAVDTGTMMLYELVPLSDITHKRTRLQVNRWGMRDKDYEKQKPADTFRIAMLGGSYGMGTGISVESTFQALVEEQLKPDAMSAQDSIELLNFSVGGYSLLQQVYLCDTRVFDFEPDAIFYLEHTNFETWAVDALRKVVQDQVSVPYPFLQELIKSTALTHDMDPSEIRRRLSPHAQEIVEWAYRRIVKSSLEHGAIPVLLYVPFIDHGPEDAPKVERLREIALDAGFRILSLEGAFEGIDPGLLSLASWDAHPNVRGNELLADELLEVIHRDESILGPGFRVVDEPQVVD